ncbi:MAG: amidohydrolase family protein [Psychromonas sp.]|nr:amidohydrolase family protein [Psychromonas sp.]
MRKQTINIIDPHVHLFNLSQGEYHWLKSENPPDWLDKSVINKNFTQKDLQLNGITFLSGFVHIEAGFNNTKPWRELEYLEQANSALKNLQGTYSQSMRTIAGLRLSLAPAVFTEHLNKCLGFRSFVGVRHILDELGFAILSSDNISHNMKALHNAKLIFEVQITFYDPQTKVGIKTSQSINAGINALGKLIKRNHNIRFIINHAGLPPENSNQTAWRQWQNNLKMLACYPNVFLKLSGAEISNRQYTTQWLDLVLSKCITTFGDHRVMLAGNFPLCLFSKDSYQDYWQTLLNLSVFKALSTSQKNALCHDNAFKIYKF